MNLSSIRMIVGAIDKENAEYILKDERVLNEFAWVSEYLEKGDIDAALYTFREVKERIARWSSNRLTPANVRVGDGVTINLWTDRHAATITRVTKATVTVRRDAATLNPDFSPEFVPGGFAAHCTNQNEQRWMYKPDPDGAEYTFHWSGKYNRYGQPGNLTLSKGRHEYYDYNF